MNGQQEEYDPSFSDDDNSESDSEASELAVNEIDMDSRLHSPEFQAAQDPYDGIWEEMRAEANRPAVITEMDSERFRSAWLRVHYTLDDDFDRRESELVYFVWSTTLSFVERRDTPVFGDSNVWQTLVTDFGVGLDKRVSIYLRKPVTVQRVTADTAWREFDFPIPSFKVQLE